MHNDTDLGLKLEIDKYICCFDVTMNDLRVTYNFQALKDEKTIREIVRICFAGLIDDTHSLHASMLVP